MGWLDIILSPLLLDGDLAQAHFPQFFPHFSPYFPGSILSASHSKHGPGISEFSLLKGLKLAPPLSLSSSWSSYSSILSMFVMEFNKIMGFSFFTHIVSLCIGVALSFRCMYCTVCSMGWVHTSDFSFGHVYGLGIVQFYQRVKGKEGIRGTWEYE